MQESRQNAVDKGGDPLVKIGNMPVALSRGGWRKFEGVRVARQGVTSSLAGQNIDRKNGVKPGRVMRMEFPSEGTMMRALLKFRFPRKK